MTGLIVAYSNNRVIGRNGEIPWRIKGEQRRFRELTTGNVVIMGRRSYEEIGHPLPNRINIIVSGSKDFTGENLVTCKSLAEAIDYAKVNYPDKNIYLSGGAGIYKEGLALCDALYVTEVDITIPDGDTFFPEFNEDEYIKTVDESVDGEIPYRYVTFTRK